MAKVKSEFMYPISQKDGNWEQELGMTKREYFAALAMQATDLEIYADKYGNKWSDEVAKDSVQMADALIKALES